MPIEEVTNIGKVRSIGEGLPAAKYQRFCDAFPFSSERMPTSRIGRQRESSYYVMTYDEENVAYVISRALPQVPGKTTRIGPSVSYAYFLLPYDKLQLKPFSASDASDQRLDLEVGSRISHGDMDIDHIRGLLGPFEQEETWTAEKDSRRCQLIDKQIQGTLSATEQREFSKLQEEALEHFDRVAPPPIAGARKLHAKLIKKKQQ